MKLKFWPIMGAICGACATPFTGGASLGLCAACAGIGFVAGSVIDKAIEENSGQRNQASPEAYNLLGKSIEEINKLREDLKKEQEENSNKERQTQEKLDNVRAKINNPDLRQSHETEEFLKKQETLLIGEINNINRKGDDINNRLTQLEKNQVKNITTGTNIASDSINNANWNNTLENFAPSFTTKLLIMGGVVLIIYLLVSKN